MTKISGAETARPCVCGRLLPPFSPHVCLTNEEEEEERKGERVQGGRTHGFLFLRTVACEGHEGKARVLIPAWSRVT